MKKIHVVCFTGNSGLTDYSVCLSKELARAADVTLVTADSFNSEAYRQNIKVRKVFRRTRHYPLDIFKFAFLILRDKPDIVVMQSWLKYPLLEIVLLKLFSRAGISVGITVHDVLPHTPTMFSKFNLSIYYRFFDKVIVHSRRAAAALKTMRVEKEPLVVPHASYDLFRRSSLKKEEARREFPEIADDDFVVLFFGHIETRKGIMEFLKASDMLKEYKNIKFLIAGRNDLNPKSASGKMFEYYRKAENLVIHDRHIPFEMVEQCFAASDIVTLPYLEGTTSGVAKLAMAFEKPLIATDVGDLAEFLEDWDGELISSNDIALELAASIKRRYLMGDKSGNVRVLDVSKYRWDVIGKKYLDYLGQDSLVQ
jgi:glycosyltransferase involved in cell wall biosynthesis